MVSDNNVSLLRTAEIIKELQEARVAVLQSITSRLENTVSKPRAVRLAEKLELSDKESVC
jgi:hypothetical protein